VNGGEFALLSQGDNILDLSERSPLLARRGGCSEGADGVVDQVPIEDPQFADKKTFNLCLTHHPGASRHPSWPGGAITGMGQVCYRPDSGGQRHLVLFDDARGGFPNEKSRSGTTPLHDLDCCLHRAGIDTSGITQRLRLTTLENKKLSLLRNVWPTLSY